VDGIAILGHWHNVNLLNGWALVEANNEATIAKWLMDWTDLNASKLSSNNLIIKNFYKQEKLAPI
jgi:hypothetical protein